MVRKILEPFASGTRVVRNSVTTGALVRQAVGAAFRVYRRNPLAIASISAVVFAPVALLGTIASTQADYLLEHGGGREVAGVVVLLATALLTAGAAVGAGLIHQVVGPEFGRSSMSMGEALRDLPKGRLLGVDLSVSLVVAIGSVIGVLPGLAAYTLLCLAGPVLVDENLGVWASLVRSFEITRHHLLVTILVVPVPVVLEHVLLDALGAFWDFPFVVLFAAHILLAVTVLAMVVLVEIALALTLVDHEADHEANREGGPDVHSQPLPL
jgi:hypothetical protein